MQHITRPITSKGRVTIPKQVRDHLGLNSNDKVTFVVDNEGRVELRSAQFKMKDLRGIVTPLPGQDPVDFEEAFDEGFRERADALRSGRLNWHAASTAQCDSKIENPRGHS